MKAPPARPRDYRLVLNKPGSKEQRRIAYAYLDRALARGAQNLLRGANHYSVVEIVTDADGKKKDGAALASGSRELHTVSFTWNNNSAGILKRTAEPLWWPSYLRKPNGTGGK